MSFSKVSVWVLLGRRHGDNRQMLTLAEAAGFPFIAKQMRFTGFSSLPNWLLGGSLLGIDRKARKLLVPPWPNVVISSGRRAAAAALWIRAQSGRTARLVHVGRPWAPLDWFDLIVTTPQYDLPARPNVLQNLMPLHKPEERPPALSEALAASLRNLPRPHICVLVGGSSRPFVLDGAAARGLAERANGEARRLGGSLLVMAGPRSSADAIAALRRAVDVPAHFFLWQSGGATFAQLATESDRFLVTCDSVSMLAEAASAGRPVDVFVLPKRPDFRFRLADRMKRILPQTTVEWLIAAGILTSVRNLTDYAAAMKDAGFLDGGASTAMRWQEELARSAARMRDLVQSA
jgi:uncharacterized protein